MRLSKLRSKGILALLNVERDCVGKVPSSVGSGGISVAELTSGVELVTAVECCAAVPDIFFLLCRGNFELGPALRNADKL